MASKCWNAFEEVFGPEDYAKKVLLQIGAPGPSDLKEVGMIIKEATVNHFETKSDHYEEILQYGCNRGSEEFRTELANFLSNTFRNPVDSEDLFVNTGSSQGLHNILSYYFQSGDTVFLGDPTYWTILDSIKKSFDFNIVGIPLDEEGIDVDELERRLEKFEGKPATARRPFRAAVYIIPTYQNPTTVCLSQDRCKKLIKLARKHDLLIIADDVYNVMTYSAPDCDDPTKAKPPVRFFYYDTKTDPDYKGNVVSISTFSKILSPGLRLGWFEMSQRVMKGFLGMLLQNSGNGRQPYTSYIVAEAFKGGLVQKHIAKLRTTLAERMKHVHKMLNNSLGKYGVKCRYPGGGIFLWVVLPNETPVKKVMDLCSEELGFTPGTRCSFSGSHGNGMRICISFYEADVLYPAVEKLCTYIKQALDEK